MASGRLVVVAVLPHGRSGKILDEARAIGLERVLIVCAADNLASARVIENNGGVLDDVPSHGLLQRRYWISTRMH